MIIRAHYVHYTPLIWSCDMVILRQILICMVAASFKTCLRLCTSVFLLAQVSWNEYNSVTSITAKTLHSLPERGVSSRCISEAPIYLGLWGGLEAFVVCSFLGLTLFLSRTLRNFPYQG
ncbi:hypothetical protein BDR03DRAFT_340388 [Suillus americanus]|nr:hypothetical protein BDR03DRAFT_340388 [Suillus americanus]